MINVDELHRQFLKEGGRPYGQSVREKAAMRFALEAVRMELKRVGEHQALAAIEESPLSAEQWSGNEALEGFNLTAGPQRRLNESCLPYLRGKVVILDDVKEGGPPPCLTCLVHFRDEPEWGRFWVRWSEISGIV